MAPKKKTEETPVDTAPTADPDLLFSYHPVVEGDHISGVPARDLSLEDYEALEDVVRDELLANSKLGTGAAIYKQEGKITEARSVRKDRREAAVAHHKASVEQTDPDSRTPGRTDADTVSPGQAVPQGDEPVSEADPGFVATDSGGSTLPG